MRIYKLSYYEQDQGTILEWHSSMVGAKKRKRELMQAWADRLWNDQPDVEIVPVDFPTRKDALLTWLNQHFNRDNG